MGDATPLLLHTPMFDGQSRISRQPQSPPASMTASASMNVSSLVQKELS